MTLLAAIGRGIGWLFAKPARFAIALALGAMAYHLAVIDPAMRADRQAARDQVLQLKVDVFNERAAHQQTKFNYAAAQAAAARLDAQRLARVKIEQQEITDDVRQDYARRLADARARADQLREEPAPAGEHPSGPGGGLPVPGAGDAAGRADGPPADHGLSDEERLVATEQAIQLDELITFVERQLSVEVNR